MHIGQSGVTTDTEESIFPGFHDGRPGQSLIGDRQEGDHNLVVYGDPLDLAARQVVRIGDRRLMDDEGVGDIAQILQRNIVIAVTLDGGQVTEVTEEAPDDRPLEDFVCIEHIILVEIEAKIGNAVTVEIVPSEQHGVLINRPLIAVLIEIPAGLDPIVIGAVGSGDHGPWLGQAEVIRRLSDELTAGPGVNGDRVGAPGQDDHLLLGTGRQWCAQS